MTKLECSVENCVHNADQCCCRGSILVDGHGARDAEGTCCASFEENKGVFPILIWQKTLHSA